MKYRWLDSDLPVKHKRLGVGTVITLPVPGRIGNVLVRRGQAQEAFVEFQTAARLQPDLAEAHNNLGCLLSGAGRQAEAADQFREALKWKPEYADARNNLGQVLAQLQSAVTNRGRRE